MIETPNTTWKPFLRQEEFLSIPDTVFEALYGGAAGGGKSDALVMLPVARDFIQNPYFKGIIFRRTYPELEKEIIMRSKKWYNLAGGKYNEQKKAWTFPSGAVMQFAHCEHEKDMRTYDSSEYQYAAFDELTSFTEWQYLYFIMSRMRTTAGSNLPIIARSGTNPGNIGHGWVRARFVEPGAYGTIFKDKLTGLKRIFIQSFYTDNPHLDADYGARLSNMPEAERRAKRDGDWYTFSGQVFSDWRGEKFADEPENAIHVVKPFEIPLWWPRFLAVDWGYEAMTYALWGALSPESRLYTYREYVARQTKVSVWSTEIGNLCVGQKLESVVMCGSAWQKMGQENVIAELFEKNSGLQPERADNDRISGKLLIQEYLRFTPKPLRKSSDKDKFDSAKANEILRVYGPKAYGDYVDFFKDATEETNLPKLQVFDNCDELINVIPLCVYDTNNKEDVAEFSGDDPYDTCRYLIKKVDSYNADKSVDKYHKDVQGILGSFHKTLDYTSLHRRMEFLERQKNQGPKPIRRFH